MNDFALIPAFKLKHCCMCWYFLTQMKTREGCIQTNASRDALLYKHDECHDSRWLSRKRAILANKEGFKDLNLFISVSLLFKI